MTYEDFLEENPKIKGIACYQGYRQAGLQASGWTIAPDSFTVFMMMGKETLVEISWKNIDREPVPEVRYWKADSKVAYWLGYTIQQVLVFPVADRKPMDNIPESVSFFTRKVYVDIYLKESGVE